MGFDEFNPGARTNYFEATKKTMAVYFSFAELESTSYNCMWFCMAAVRTMVLDKLQGKWSKVFVAMLHRTFLGPHGLTRVGACFSHRGKD